MGRSVELDDEVYERIEALSRADETVSDATARLIDGPSVLDLVGAFDDDESAQLREASEAVTAGEQDEVDDLHQRIDERFDQSDDAELDERERGPE